MSRTSCGPVEQSLLSTESIRTITAQITEDRDEGFPGPLSLIETTDPDEINYNDDLYHHADYGFNDCKGIDLDQ